jgi:hypothetical protein
LGNYSDDPLNFFTISGSHLLEAGTHVKSLRKRNSPISIPIPVLILKHMFGVMKERFADSSAAALKK